MFSVPNQAENHSNYGPSSSPKVSSNEPSDFSRMKVCVRVRPLNLKEMASGSKSIIDVIDQNMLVFDPVDLSEEASDHYLYHGKRYKAIGKRANKNEQYLFNRVFSPNEDNITVYQETTKSLVSSLMAGFNCSVFAYGSTGSGKTHTMLGSADNPGIIFFTTMDLFKQIEKEEHSKLEVFISYFEIYNEIFYDLLEPNSEKPLSVLEDANNGMAVKNLSSHQPRDADHLIEMLEYGNQNRKQHPTDSNAESSRSHAIFQISLRRKDYNAAQEMTMQVSKMSLIDLAGSERANVAYRNFRNKGLHREGSNINKSLLSLGNCINALANSTSKSSYVPYRSSKLTLILRDSLGGNCQTLMIATASASSCHYEETHNTLLYAERAKGVQLNVRKNNVALTVQPRDYKQIIAKMSSEKAKMEQTIDELKHEMAKYKSMADTIPNKPIVSTRGAIQNLHAVKPTLDHLFAQRIELRAKLLDCEHHIKMLDLRLMSIKLDKERMTAINAHCESDVLSTNSSLLHSILMQKLEYTKEQALLVKEVEENEEKIQGLQNELIDATQGDIVSRIYLMENNCHAQTKDVALGEKHTANFIEDLVKRDIENYELITSAYSLSSKIIKTLKEHKLLSEDLESSFRNLTQKLEGKKTVVWRDNLETPKKAKLKEVVNLSKLPLYMNGDKHTPTDKHSLVAVLEITPRPKAHLKRTQFTSVSPNMTSTNNHPQSRSPKVYNLPNARNYPVKLGKEITFGSSNSSASISSNRRIYEPSNSSQIGQANGSSWRSNQNFSSNSHMAPRFQQPPFYGTNSNYVHSSGASTFGWNRSTATNHIPTYPHNPNFRFNPRR